MPNPEWQRARLLRNFKGGIGLGFELWVKGPPRVGRREYAFRPSQIGETLAYISNIVAPESAYTLAVDADKLELLSEFAEQAPQQSFDDWVAEQSALAGERAPE